MNTRDFAYWLQGYFELTHEPNQILTKEQLDTIKYHLALCLPKEAAHSPTVSYAAAPTC